MKNGFTMKMVICPCKAYSVWRNQQKKRINHCDTVLYFYNCVQGFKFQKLLKGCLKNLQQWHLYKQFIPSTLWFLYKVVNDIDMYRTVHVLICLVKNPVIFSKSKPLMLLLLCVKIITIYEFPWSFPQINYFS